MSYFPRFGLLPLLAMTVVLGATGCPLSQNQAAAGTNQAGTQDQSSDPAAANLAQGVAWTQVYAGLAEPNGRELLGTWNHFDHGNQKPAEDVVYRYDLDPHSGLERTQLLSGKDAEAMKQRLCGGQDAVPGLARGQDSPLCQQLVKPLIERKPVTTPPANNRGKSVPPGSRH